MSSSASSAASSIFSSGTSLARESPAHAAATAYASAKSARSAASFSYGTIFLIALTGIITTLAIVAASVYFSGYADDVAEWWAKRYYKAKAIAEVKVLENVGSEKVQGAVKGELPSFLPRL
jgi:hypothetical protein